MSETDLISRQDAIDTLDKHLRTTDVPESYPGMIPALTEWLNELPSAQADSKELSPTHKALDTISRQAAVDRINKQREHLQPEIYPQDKIGDAAYRICAEFIERLPPAQPELPEWAHKVEEYCQNTPSYINNPLAWALYQVWKEYDGRLVHQRGKENR